MARQRDCGKSVMGEVSYRSAERDFVDTHRSWFKANLRSSERRWRVLRTPATLALVAIVGLLCSTSNYEFLGYPLMAGAAGGFFAWIGCLTLSYALIPRRTRRLLRQQKNLHGEFTYGWSSQGLHYRAPDSAGVIKWPDMHRWHESPTTFLFFLSEAMCHFIPRRVLSEDEAAELRGLAVDQSVKRY